MVTERDDLDLDTKDKAEEKKTSKTQELRDWLDAEIKRRSRDAQFLREALNKVKEIDGFGRLPWEASRYANLTFEELDLKMAEDRKKLEEIEKRLEIMHPARELDVDIDSLEEAGVQISRMASHAAIFEGDYRITNVDYNFRIDAGMRHFSLRISGGIGFVCCSYDSVVSFKVERFVPNWRNERKLVLGLPLSNCYLVVCY